MGGGDWGRRRAQRVHRGPSEEEHVEEEAADQKTSLAVGVV